MSLPSDARQSVATKNGKAGPARVIGLVTLLVVLVGSVTCERISGGLRPAYYHFASFTTHDVLFVFTAVHVVAYVGGGLVVDALGARRAIGLALIVWCGLTMMSGVTTDPLDLRICGLLVALAFGIINTGALAAIRHEVPANQRALPLALVTLAGYLWLLAIPYLRTILVKSAPEFAEASDKREWVDLVCATIGAGMTMIWLIGFHERGARDNRSRARTAALLRSPTFWSLLLLTGLMTIVFETGYLRLFPFLTVERSLDTTSVGTPVLAPYIAAIGGTIGAAIWSDQIASRTSSVMRSRGPFVVGGFVFGAAICLIPIARQDDLIAMACIAAIGIGMQSIVALIVLDVAPRGAAGILIGTMLAFAMIVRAILDDVSIGIYQAAHSLAPVLVLGGIASAIGAAASLVLLRTIKPLEDASEG